MSFSGSISPSSSSCYQFSYSAPDCSTSSVGSASGATSVPLVRQSSSQVSICVFGQAAASAVSASAFALICSTRLCIGSICLLDCRHTERKVHTLYILHSPSCAFASPGCLGHLIPANQAQTGHPSATSGFSSSSGDLFHQ